MSRSSFALDRSPLLPQHENSIPLNDLTPLESYTVSRSPPPQFYQGLNSGVKVDVCNHAADRYSNLSLSPSSSPSRAKTRRIQFAAPPPPIATSILIDRPLSYDQSKNTSGKHNRQYQKNILRAYRGPTDPFLALERREMAIHANLQLLLDAQSSGLVPGFGGKDDGHEIGAESSASNNMIRGAIMPVRQPQTTRVGLRGARRGLAREMWELIGVKREMVAILTEEIRKQEETLSQIQRWENRMQNAKNEIDKVATHAEVGDEEVFKNEQRAVGTEICELENRLVQMRARFHWLGEKIQESINRKEARISGFRGALTEVEREVGAFLKRSPVGAAGFAAEREGEVESVWSLPIGRRTLGLAASWCIGEIDVLSTKRTDVERETQALSAGVSLWENVVRTVTCFEDGLRISMATDIDEVGNQENLRSQIKAMVAVIEKLDGVAVMAAEKGWNLLICAVGAEVEAFREGEMILRRAVQALQSNNEGYDEKKEGQGEREGEGLDPTGLLLDDHDMHDAG